MSPIKNNPIRQISLKRGACARFHWPTGEIFQQLRISVITIHKGTQTAVPHRDARSPICLAWLSYPRRQTKPTTNRRAHYEKWRKGHGSARAIENLRGLRQPFLPRPEPREYLLPR